MDSPLRDPFSRRLMDDPALARLLRRREELLSGTAPLSDEVRDLLRRMREESDEAIEGLPPEAVLLLDFARAAVKTPALRAMVSRSHSLEDVLNVLALDRLVVTGAWPVEALDLSQSPRHALQSTSPGRGKA